MSSSNRNAPSPHLFRDQILRLTTIALLSLTFLVPTFALAPNAGAQDQDHKLKVVASFSVLGDWIQNVAGDKIDLEILVPAGGDTHTFDPSPEQVSHIVDADLLFENGAGFEPWLDDIFDSSGTDATKVVVSDGVTLRTIPEDHDHAAGSSEEGHDHGSTDPHIWGNVQNAIIAVNNISTALSVADPANATTYETNAQNYITQLETLDGWVKSEIEKIPAADRKLVTSHDALGYYTDAYGLTIVGTVLGTTTEEAEPSAQQITELVHQIEDSGVKAIFAENIENPSVIEAVAKEAGVTVGPVLYTDALGESGSDGDTYLKMITYNTTSIVSALLGE